MIKRRQFISLLGGMAGAALPLVTRAQQVERIRQIGVLMGGAAPSDPEGRSRIAVFRAQLENFGWVEGRNLRIDVRWAAGAADVRLAFAAELRGLKPDVLVAASTSSLSALKSETKTPIVFVQVVDPIGEANIHSLARPGGNVTGFTNFEYAIGGKWLETLRQIAPQVRQVVVLLDAQEPRFGGFIRFIEVAAATVDVQVTVVSIIDATEIDRRFEAIAGMPNSGLIVLPGPVSIRNRERIIKRAIEHGLPAVYPYSYFVRSGGLISYGIDTIDLYRRAATYVDRILRGEKPADLPIQQPTKFELVINVKTAKALGLTVPPMLLARADEVIE